MRWPSWTPWTSRPPSSGHLLVHGGDGLYLAENLDTAPRRGLPFCHLDAWRRVAASPRTKRLWPVLAILILWIATIVFSAQRPAVPHYGPHSKDSVVLDPRAIASGRQKLVILLPIDRPGHDLCKVLASAAALGYPPPVLVNWRKDFDTDTLGIGPSHLAKVAGTLDFLDYALSSNLSTTDPHDRLQDHDLVLMMDALDIWFQLPPEVLLTRYHAIVQSENRRLAWSSDLYDQASMEHTTVAAAQKGCMGPRDPYSQLHCSALPASPVPADVYGPYTEFSPLGWKWRRPRYLNSGSVMGPAADMRRYFARIRSKMAKHEKLGEHLGGDQGVFSEVFGEQEVWRQSILRGENTSTAKTSTQQKEAFEYHLTLDYTQELFYPTGYSENDADFTVLGDRGSETHPLGMASDIEAVASPLEALDGVPATETRWNHKSLFTDFWMGSVPVAVHHNAWRHGLKKRREAWWHRMWYFPYLRDLLAVRARTAERGDQVLWRAPASNGTLEVGAYGTERQHGKKQQGATSALALVKRKGEDTWALREVDWEQTCRSDDAAVETKRAWHEEVFRDGKGPFRGEP